MTIRFAARLCNPSLRGGQCFCDPDFQPAHEHAMWRPDSDRAHALTLPAGLPWHGHGLSCLQQTTSSMRFDTGRAESRNGAGR
ncbi:hypothetical protein SALBM311S_10144 [Streptomyces alboniger]